MPEVQIKSFEEGDLKRLQQIREAAFAPIFRSLREIVGPEISAIALASEEKEQAELLANLCDPKSPGKVFVALIDGLIIGFVSISLDHEKRIGEIGLNAVHPDFSGRGIGTHLYQFAVKEMRQSGMLVATVGTGGDPSHAPARRVYEKAGFSRSIPSIWMYCLL